MGRRRLTKPEKTNFSKRLDPRGISKSESSPMLPSSSFSGWPKLPIEEARKTLEKLLKVYAVTH
jgi:hypothetical protein